MNSSVVAQTFEDVTAASGLAGVSPDDSMFVSNKFGTGMCGADFDGDGDVDIVVAGNAGDPHLYFRNDGSMTFVDDSQYAGLGVSVGVRACRAADVDNDGDADLYLGNYFAAPSLFINDGTGRFVDEASVRGLTHVTGADGASFGDYDRDGLLDLFVANRFVDEGVIERAPSILYRNTGAGYFEDVTAFAGVAHPQGATFLGVFFDADEDGWPDLYMVNEKGVEGEPNRLFRNTGDGRFVEVRGIGTTDHIDGMGMDYVDVFNDGGMDFYVSDEPTDHVFRVWHPSRGQFVDETYAFGVVGGFSGWAINWCDFDNDRWFDLHVVHGTGPNHIYRNPGTPHAAGQPWQLVPNPLAPSMPQYTAVFADFDDDGRVDILHRLTGLPAWGDGLALHRNVTPPRNWIRIRTIGSASNREGLGARIEIHAAGMTQRQTVRSDVGYMGSSEPRVHFGLGDETVVDRIDVYWPSGLVQTLRDVAANRLVTIREPSLRLVGTPAVGTASVIEVAAPSEAGRSYAVMLAMNDRPHTPIGDGRSLPIRVDGLTALSLTPGNVLLHGNVAALHRGVGGGLLTLPADDSLRGLRLYAAAITFDADGIGTVFPLALPIDIE